MEELLGFIPGAGQGLPEQRQTDRKPDTHTHTLGKPCFPQGCFTKVTVKTKGKKKSIGSFPPKFHTEKHLQDFFSQNLWVSSNEHSIQFFGICKSYLQKQNWDPFW